MSSEKYTCDCGSIILNNKKSISSHIKTKKHLAFENGDLVPTVVPTVVAAKAVRKTRKAKIVSEIVEVKSSEMIESLLVLIKLLENNNGTIPITKTFHDELSWMSGITIATVVDTNVAKVVKKPRNTRAKKVPSADVAEAVVEESV